MISLISLLAGYRDKLSSVNKHMFVDRPVLIFSHTFKIIRHALARCGALLSVLFSNWIDVPRYVLLRRNLVHDAVIHPGLRSGDHHFEAVFGQAEIRIERVQNFGAVADRHEYFGHGLNLRLENRPVRSFRLSPRVKVIGKARRRRNTIADMVNHISKRVGKAVEFFL